MNFRAGGIAIAFVAIAGIPAVISQANQPAAPTTPAAKEATLTVPLSGAEKVNHDTGRLLIMAAGTPPRQATDLLSSSGREAVSVSGLPDSDCEGLPALRALGQGATTPWCLQLDDLSDGSQVAGKLAGPRTVLALTVSRRSAFFGLPLVAVLLGLLAGILALVVPLKVRERIRKGLVDKALDENDGREPGKKIVGLREWVDRQRRHDQEDDDILPLVDWVMDKGPAVAAEGRAELRRRLIEADLPEEHGYRTGAESFLEEIAEPKADDFFADGKPAPGYRTDEWVDGLEKLGRQQRELEALEQKVAEVERPSDETKKALQASRRAFSTAARPAAVDGVDEKLDALRETLGETALIFEAPRFKTRTLLFADMAHVTVGGVGGQGAAKIEVAPEIEPLPSRPTLDRLWPYRLATAALVGLALLFAVLTIEHTVFEPIADFGDYQDYFALVSAAIVAGVSSTVVALLSPWNSSEPPAS